MPLVLSRREREKLTRRSEILSAARSVFAEKGYSKATLDEIAQRSEFGKGTLYNYFEGGKEEILIAILNQLYDGLAEICDSVFAQTRLESEPIRSLFREFLVLIFDHFTEHSEVFIINLKEAHNLLFAENNNLSAAVAERRMQAVGLLSRPLGYGMNTGQLRQMPADAVANLLFGNIKGMQMQRCLVNIHGENAFAGCDGAGPSPTTKSNSTVSDSSAESTTDSPPTYDCRSSAGQADFLVSILFDGLLNSSKTSDDVLSATKL